MLQKIYGNNSEMFEDGGKGFKGVMLSWEHWFVTPENMSPGRGSAGRGGARSVPFTCDPGLNHSGRNQNAKLQVEDLFPGGTRR